MKLYLYGIIDSIEQIHEPVSGIENSCVYNIPYCDIGTVVSEISGLTRQTIEDDVLKHEAVIEKLMADFTILPVRFQTVINDRNSLLSIMQSFYQDFTDNLERLHNKLEFGIKVIWPAEKMKEKIIKNLKSGRQEDFEPEISQGRKFMTETFQKYKIDKEFRQVAEKYINIIDSCLSRFAAEKKVRKLKTDKLLLDAVYLVEKLLVSNFKEEFERLKNDQPDFKYLFSGPWPAYNFVILLRQDQDSSRTLNNQNMIGANSL
jgi:hypothetical protein